MYDFDHPIPIGVWDVSIHPGIPDPTADYFVRTCKVAWDALDHLHELLPAETVAGPVRLVPQEAGKAGWYKKGEDIVTITGALGAPTAYGQQPEALYGSNLGKSLMTHALLHELAHRIWFRHLGVRGRATWSLGRLAMSAGVMPAQEAWAEVVVGLALNKDAMPAGYEPLVSSVLAHRGPGAPLEGRIEVTEARIRELAHRSCPLDRALARAARLVR